MNIQLSDHFGYRKLLRFTFPTIVMMIFTSIYGVVDGMFVTNCVGTNEFAALNMIMPVCMIPGSIGFMLGTGGSALVARLLGEKLTEKANRVFSMLIYVTVAVGAAVSLIAIAFLPAIAAALGAEGKMLDDCVLYGRILLISAVAFMLQNEFQSFLVVAEKPQFGLAVTVSAGVTNIVLDAVMVWLLDWGLLGAALATALSQTVGCIIPLIYFALSKHSLLRLTRWKPDGRALLKACINGSSEMMTGLSLSIVNMLYNSQLFRLAQEIGIAAYGSIMYVNFIYISVFIGYSIGSSPIISFHYGAQNHKELRNVRRKSLRLLLCGAVGMTLLSMLLSTPLSYVFGGYNPQLYDMTRHAFLVYSLSYLFAGFNIFGSAFFTALNNGLISAIISFARTLVFQVVAILVLPLLFGLEGIWWSIVAAESLALCTTVILLVVYRKKYNY